MPRVYFILLYTAFLTLNTRQSMFIPTLILLLPNLESKVIDNSLSINGLLCKETSSGKHGKTTVLMFLCSHHIELLIISGLQSKRIETNIARVVIHSHLLMYS